MSEQMPSIMPREAVARPDADELDERTRLLLDRVGIFRDQLDAWRRAGRIGIPVLTLPDAPVLAAGRCLSCGEPVPAGRWRCELCLDALGLLFELEGQVELHHSHPVGAPERLADVEAAIEDRSESWRSPR